ncbi:MAG: ribosome maturation factor RimM [Defluviitaleaceae bacterium]|nr:ribosome maturation factor RimM [Defluviitaleaceae bacterium]MCL2262129.1 ribosome maturation factor RimM [Defluviitaleaceae bacterium]
MADFQIGIITKAQGIRGEFRVLPTTDDPARFELLIGGEINIGGAAYKLANARLQKNIVILKLVEVNDRNAAEKLIGAEIFVPQEKALPLDDGEYYIRDLVGLQAETESGEDIGVLSRVLHTGANDVYVIETSEGESFMLPAIKDVIVDVDIKGGKIILRLLDGIRELKI